MYSKKAHFLFVKFYRQTYIFKKVFKLFYALKSIKVKIWEKNLF